MPELILGTANCDKWEDGVLDAAWEAGIRWLDCAAAYPPLPPGTDRFEIIWKLSPGDRPPEGCAVVMSHYGMDYPLMHSEVSGVSLYYPGELAAVMQYGPEVVQMPYKAFRMWLPHLRGRGVRTHVRKVFADGCYREALRDPDVHSVVIGVDNAAQLEENAKLWRECK
jgi:aryl-alcohol dehydrogenase-like predicted oxidoreductase